MSDDSMIAFLPSNGSWVKQDFPHMTLVYGGSIEGRDISEFNQMGKDAITAARAIRTFSLNATGVETLGEEPDRVDTLVFYPTPQLLVARKIVESWNKSEFTDFKPHVTIGPAGSAYADMVKVSTNDYEYPKRRRDMLPTSVYFDRLAVCWGDDRLIFDLGIYD